MMAALVLQATLLPRHVRRIRLSGLPRYERRGLNGVSFGFHEFPRFPRGRCFLRITSSRVGQIQGKGLQAVAARDEGGSEEEREKDAVGFGVVKGAANSILEAVCSVQKPAMVALLFCMLVSQDPEMAVAASGGRVGGNSFRSYYSYSL